VLEVARHTEYYLPRLIKAQLATEQAINDLTNVEEGIDRLPRTELRDLLADPRRFQNRIARGLRWPDPEQVTGARDRWLPLRRPETLVGPVSALLRLTSIPESIRRIVVASRVTTGLLREDQRESLWDAFERPVFERLVGLDGETLASECVAHAGLHLNPECVWIEGSHGDESELVLTSLAGVRYPLVRLRTGLIARADRSRCGCGDPSPRLVFSESHAALRKPPDSVVAFDSRRYAALAR
jgi:hypothetical protein